MCLGIEEIVERDGGIFLHVGLRGVGAVALAVAAVVEGEDVDAGLMQQRQVADVGQGAVAVMQVEDGGGIDVGRGDPPAGQTWLAGRG